MKVTGIICEYNPFHNGHKYHIEQTKKLCGSDYIIGVMSGCFTQRGAPAIIDKYTRTQMALHSGCDMIIEIPVRYATASAEGFASAAITMLSKSGIVNSVCFGTEQGNLEGMTTIAQILKEEPEDYRKFLMEEMRTGTSYPAARQAAFNSYIASNLIPSDTGHNHTERNTVNIDYKPNNILAIEYIKACLDSNITPYTIKRTDKGYHSLKLSRICSAEALRHLLLISKDISALVNYVPDSTLRLLKHPIDPEDFALLLYASISSSINELEQYVDISKGLAARIKKHLYDFSGWDSFIQLIKSKQYTYTRVQRALLHCLLRIRTLTDYNCCIDEKYPVPYIRVLGFRKEASSLMRALNESASISVITRPAKAADMLDPFGMQLLSEDIGAAELYRQVVQNRYHINSSVNEYTNGLIIV